MTCRLCGHTIRPYRQPGYVILLCDYGCGCYENGCREGAAP